MNTALLISNIALWLIVLPLVFVTISLARFLQGTIRKEVAESGLPPGSRLSDTLSLRFTNLDGEVTTLGLSAHRTLLVFVRPACPECHKVAPQVDSFFLQHQRDLAGALVVIGSLDDTRSFVKASGIKSIPVLCDNDAVATDAFKVKATPVAILVNGDGIVMDKLSTTEFHQFKERILMALRQDSMEASSAS